MTAIAEAAGVALDTVYAAVGPKPVLFRLLLETAISGADDAVPAESRDYVRAIRSAPDAPGRLRIYAAALRRVQPRLAHSSPCYRWPPAPTRLWPNSGRR